MEYRLSMNTHFASQQERTLTYVGFVLPVNTGVIHHLLLLMYCHYVVSLVIFTYLWKKENAMVGIIALAWMSNDTANLPPLTIMGKCFEV